MESIVQRGELGEGEEEKSLIWEEEEQEWKG